MRRHGLGMALVLCGLLVGCGDSGAGGEDPAGKSGQAELPATSAAEEGEGTVLLEADFETDSGPFATGNAPEGLIQVDGGKLNINAVSGELLTQANLAQAEQVVRIEANALTTSAGARAAVSCVAGDAGEYRFGVGPDSQAVIARIPTGGDAEELGTGSVLAFEITGAQLRAECLTQGPGLPARFILFANDQSVVDVEDPEGLGEVTGVKLGAERYGDQPIQVYFDDVRVSSF
jgi:hypothetical protein